MDLAVAKCFNEVTKNAVATSLLKFDKSLQIFQKFYIVLLFQRRAVVKKPLAKVIVHSSLSQHIQKHHIQVLSK